MPRLSILTFAVLIIFLVLVLTGAGINVETIESLREGMK